MHVSYSTHIASLLYIENFSTYAVSRRHVHIAYNDTSLHKHREVKMSRSTIKTSSLSGTFERSHGIFHNQREVKRSKSNQFFPRNVSRHIEISYVSTFLKFLTHLFYFILSILPGYRKKRRKSASSPNFQGKL